MTNSTSAPLNQLDASRQTQDACELAKAVIAHLEGTARQVRVLCTAADADGFVAPVLDELASAGYASRITLQCAWNQPVKFGEVALSPANRTYSEPFRESASDILLLLQSGLFDDTQDPAPHLQGLATARTNISHALGKVLPESIIVASAVSEFGAFEALLQEFPGSLRDRFVPITLQVVKGPLNKLTFADYREVPALVRARRAQLASQAQSERAALHSLRNSGS